jgi:hypothetical protein
MTARAGALLVALGLGACGPEVADRTSSSTGDGAGGAGGATSAAGGMAASGGTAATGGAGGSSLPSCDVSQTGHRSFQNASAQPQRITVDDVYVGHIAVGETLEIDVASGDHWFAFTTLDGGFACQPYHDTVTVCSAQRFSCENPKH